MENIFWLQDWYAAQCDGDWEHGYGVTIRTLDNPGWSVTINLVGTPYAGIPLTPVEREGEEDWIVCRIKDRAFEEFGGAKISVTS